MDAKTAQKTREAWAVKKQEIGGELVIMADGEYAVQIGDRIHRLNIYDDPYIEERAMQAALSPFVS